MNKEQIKQAIKDRIDTWGIALFLINTALLLFSIPSIIEGTFLEIAIILLVILGIIDFFGILTLLMYIDDLIEEKHDKFINREKDVLILLWKISPLFAIAIIPLLPLDRILLIIIAVVYVTAWGITKYLLDKDDE